MAGSAAILSAAFIATAALAEDCASAALVVAPMLTRTGCRSARVIDRRSLMTRGAHAVWIEGKELVVRDDRTERGERPWVSYPWMETEERPSRRGRTAERE